jgi:polysaccharide export outer membrane protein
MARASLNQEFAQVITAKLQQFALAGRGIQSSDRVVRFAAVLLALTSPVLAGCSTFISQSGPSRSTLVEEAQLRTVDGPDQKLQYALVPLNQGTVRMLGAEEKLASFPDEPVVRRAADGAIGVGDLVSITVFESDSGGLFLPREGGTRAGNFVTVPTQQVGRDGNIEMPYAGILHVAGSSPGAVSSLIERRLADKALEPQVVVSVVDRRATPVSVLGEVTNGTRFTLDPGGARILEAIARAGGPKFPAYESMVTLQRGGRAYKALLSEIARNPAQNVELQPNDVVYVSHEPRYFLAMGAIGQSASFGPLDRRFTFNDDHIMLIDALGRAGGLLDERSNATGIFVYRMMPRDKMAGLGIVATSNLPEMVPTVFLLDLRDPAGYFYSANFAVQHEDILYVSNSPASDLAKFLSLLAPITGSSSAIRSTVN